MAVSQLDATMTAIRLLKGVDSKRRNSIDALLRTWEDLGGRLIGRSSSSFHLKGELKGFYTGAKHYNIGHVQFMHFNMNLLILFILLHLELKFMVPQN